jgi:hypothetical protein
MSPLKLLSTSKSSGWTLNLSIILMLHTKFPTEIPRSNLSKVGIIIYLSYDYREEKSMDNRQDL